MPGATPSSLCCLVFVHTKSTQQLNRVLRKLQLCVFLLWHYFLFYSTSVIKAGNLLIHIDAEVMVIIVNVVALILY